MRRADRAACNLPNDLGGAQLMGGIARGKLRGHRIGRYALIFFQPRAQRSFIQRSGLPARMIMSATQRNHRITLQRLLQAMAAGCRISAHDNVFNRAVLGPNASYFSTPSDLQTAWKQADHIPTFTAESTHYTWPAVTQAYANLASRLRG